MGNREDARLKHGLLSSLLWLLLILPVWVHASDSARPAPDFELPELTAGVPLEEAEKVRLSDYRGRVVLLDFWASWCGPCRASFPAYDAMRQRLQEKLGEHQFEILAVNVDITREEAEAFLQAHPVRFPILRETTGTTQQNYQLIAMPTAFLINAQGEIVLAHHGFSPGFAEQLERAIENLVQGQL